MYLKYARSAELSPQTVDLGNGAKGHWLGDEKAKKVLVWYHGMDRLEFHSALLH